MEPTPDQAIRRDATLSEDGHYRYSLTRAWGPPGATRPVVWVMLNPSTADASVDDPTIRRIVGFTRAWGHSAATVVNLYGWRATKPEELAKVWDPVGPGNEAAIGDALDSAALVMAAWGATPVNGREGVEARVHGLALNRGIVLHHLGLTKSGHPRHPLYVPGVTLPKPWVAS